MFVEKRARLAFLGNRVPSLNDVVACFVANERTKRLKDMGQEKRETQQTDDNDKDVCFPSHSYSN